MVYTERGITLITNAIATPVNEWPLIGAIDIVTGQAKVPMHVTRDIVWFSGHFPGEPVLPGVVQVHWAIKLATTLFSDLATFSTLRNLKFNQVILPETQIVLTLTQNSEKKSVTFIYTHGDTTCSSGTAIFSVL